MAKYVSNVTTFKVDTAFNLNTFVSEKKKKKKTSPNKN